jgi:hypothetical protein
VDKLRNYIRSWVLYEDKSESSTCNGQRSRNSRRQIVYYEEISVFFKGMVGLDMEGICFQRGSKILSLSKHKVIDRMSSI